MAGRQIFTNTADAQLRLEFDGDSYADFEVGSTGDLVITPQGGSATLAGNLRVNGVLRGNTAADGSATAGGIHATGASQFDAAMFFTGYVTSTVAAGANVDALALGDAFTYFLEALGAGVNLRGIAAPSSDGRPLWLVNNSGFDVTVFHDHASAPAANRIRLAGNVAQTLLPNGSLLLNYRNSRWYGHLST